MGGGSQTSKAKYLLKALTYYRPEKLFEIICKEIEKLWIVYKGVKCVNIPNLLSLHIILIFFGASTCE